MKKLRYIGIIVGTVIGLGIAKASTGTEFWTLLPVPLGIIGYALGALCETSNS